MKATAIAHPIQGLIKYHGLADPVLRLPFHDSISVCTAPLTTRTTIEFGEVARDRATIDERDVTARDMERIRAVVDPIRETASLRTPFRMASVNDFPSNIGLGASASGFAALAMAAAHAAGLRLSLEEISRFARRGAGSASRSVTGGFSKWKMGLTDEDSYATQLAGPDLPVVVNHDGSLAGRAGHGRGSARHSGRCDLISGLRSQAALQCRTALHVAPERLAEAVGRGGYSACRSRDGS